MICSKCGNETEEDWEFCPRCGARISRNDLFSDIFEMVEKEISNVNKRVSELDDLFEKNFEVLDISPFFRTKPKGRGFTIKITQSSGDKPKVSVKTFGNVDRKGIEHEIEKIGLEKFPTSARTHVSYEVSKGVYSKQPSD